MDRFLAGATGLGRLKAEVKSCRTVGLFVGGAAAAAGCWTDFGWLWTDEVDEKGLKSGLLFFFCWTLLLLFCCWTDDDDDDDVKGFFMRRLARRADVRLLLMGVRVRTAGGGGLLCCWMMKGGGLDGADLRERRSLACRRKAEPPALPSVLDRPLPPLLP